MAALFAAATSCAASRLPVPSAAVSRSYRLTEPYYLLLSDAPQLLAGFEVEARFARDAGWTDWG